MGRQLPRAQRPVLERLVLTGSLRPPRGERSPPGASLSAAAAGRSSGSMPVYHGLSAEDLRFALDVTLVMHVSEALDT